MTNLAHHPPVPLAESHVERIEHQENLPLRVFVHSVRSCASHRHRDCEFLLVLRGEILVQTSAGQIQLKTDDVFFIPGGEIHLTNDTSGSNIVAALQIDTAFASRFDPDFPRRRVEFNPLARRYPHDPRIKATRTLIARILSEQREQQAGYRMQLESRLLDLLTLLVRQFPSTLVSTAHSASSAQEEDELGQRLGRIAAHVELHSSEELSSGDLARSEGVSVSYLARLFKDRLGCTFSDYVNLIRAKKSLAQLARADTTILEIALDFGFPSVKSYNTVFKRLYGTTPSQWRREHAGGNVPGIGESAYNRVDTGFAYHLLKKYLTE